MISEMPMPEEESIYYQLEPLELNLNEAISLAHIANARDIDAAKHAFKR